MYNTVFYITAARLVKIEASADALQLPKRREHYGHPWEEADSSAGKDQER